MGGGPPGRTYCTATAPNRRDTAIDTRALDLTVLICTRNRPDLLRRCLDALLAGRAAPAEVVVVDQSDGDATRTVVEAVASTAPARVRYVRSPGGGMAAGQNLGFAAVTTGVVLVTDDDAVPAADWVAVAAARFAEDPALALLTGRVVALGPDEPDRLPVSTRTSTVPLVLDETTAPWDVGSGNNFGVRTDALRAVGGNDERLGPGAPERGAADMDLFRRLLRSGARGAYEPALLVEHERASRAERMARRGPYGYGMGVACALWRRQGDPAAAALTRRWLAMRGRRLLRSLRHARLTTAREEVVVLAATTRGLAHGRRLPAGPVQTEHRS